MFTSSGKRVKQGPKAAAQRKLGLAARISYAIGGIVALLWLFYFVFPYSKNLENVGLPDSVTELKEKANSLDLQLEAARHFPFPEKPVVEEVPESAKKDLLDLSVFSPDDMREIKSLMIEWEQQTGKNFLQDHPSKQLIENKNILHTTDDRKPIIRSLSSILSNPEQLLNEGYYPPDITLLDMALSNSFRANIIGHIDYIEGGETKTLTLPNGVCAFTAGREHTVEHMRYGRVNLVECSYAWNMFLLEVYLAGNDKDFLNVNPSYNTAELQTKLLLILSKALDLG